MKDFIQLASKQIINPSKIVKILKDDQDYLIHQWKAPPYPLSSEEFKWLLYSFHFLVEVDKDVVINVNNIFSFSETSVILEDSSEIPLTAEKVNLLKNSCLQLDCGQEDHPSHLRVLNFAERIAFLEQKKLENDPNLDKIDENSYKKLL